MDPNKAICVRRMEAARAAAHALPTTQWHPQLWHGRRAPRGKLCAKNSKPVGGTAPRAPPPASIGCSVHSTYVPASGRPLSAGPATQSPGRQSARLGQAPKERQAPTVPGGIPCRAGQRPEAALRARLIRLGPQGEDAGAAVLPITPCRPVPCRAVPCSTVQCSAVQCSGECSPVQCSPVPCRAGQSSAVKCSAAPCSGVQRCAAQCRGALIRRPCARSVPTRSDNAASNRAPTRQCHRGRYTSRGRPAAR